MVEHVIRNDGVGGSSPFSGTIKDIKSSYFPILSFSNNTISPISTPLVTVMDGALNRPFTPPAIFVSYPDRKDLSVSFRSTDLQICLTQQRSDVEAASANQFNRPIRDSHIRRKHGLSKDEIVNSKIGYIDIFQSN